MSYELKPVVSDDMGNVREAQEGESPEMWSIYWVRQDGSSMWIADFMLFTHAQRFFNLLVRK